jgi:NADH-quinone oxidoreductase subunit A
MAQELTEFGKVFLFIALGVVFVVLGFITSRFIRPHRPSPEKLTTYECGEEPQGDAWIQFNIRFYVVALIFIIFDVEVLFLYPWATVFKQLGGFALVEAVVFLGILTLGLVYAWKKGDLDWVVPTPNIPRMPDKKFEKPKKAVKAPKPEAAEPVA